MENKHKLYIIYKNNTHDELTGVLLNSSMNDNSSVFIIDDNCFNIINTYQREQLIKFLREQSKLNNITLYENNFEFADKLLKAIK